MPFPINIDNNDTFSKIGATISIATLYVGMTVNAIDDDATAAAIRTHCTRVVRAAAPKRFRQKAGQVSMKIVSGTIDHSVIFFHTIDDSLFYIVDIGSME
jgi:hypothetical protein